MGYYEEKKKELEDLLSTIRTERTQLETAARQERKKLDDKFASVEKLREGVVQMAKERQIGFPWLAKAYDEFFQLQANQIANVLSTKQHPAVSAADAVK